MLKEPCPDAVEALAVALADQYDPDADFRRDAAKIANVMLAEGFTITSQPAMTEEELDWRRDLDLVKLNLEQLRGLSGFILTDGELDVLIQRVARVTEYFAKKFRG